VGTEGIDLVAQALSPVGSSPASPGAVSAGR
jgi:hypothetical protein